MDGIQTDPSAALDIGSPAIASPVSVALFKELEGKNYLIYPPLSF